MIEVSQRLLLSRDSPAVEVVNPGGGGSSLLIGDHAGNAVPTALGDLGVGAADRYRHIGWDIGVDALGRGLSVRLDAQFIRQHYSRLVIDCNRDPAAPSAMPEVSDGTPILGNIGLSAEDRAARVAAIYQPYQAAIGAALARRERVLVALHSFTPHFGGNDRRWHVGILHDGHNDSFARRLMAWLTDHSGFVVGDNEPYRMDTTDHTVPLHAFAADRPYVEIEVRQDLLQSDAGVAAMVELLAAGFEAVV